VTIHDLYDIDALYRPSHSLYIVQVYTVAA